MHSPYIHYLPMKFLCFVIYMVVACLLCKIILLVHVLQETMKSVVAKKFNTGIKSCKQTLQHYCLFFHYVLYSLSTCVCYVDTFINTDCT